MTQRVHIFNTSLMVHSNKRTTTILKKQTDRMLANGNKNKHIIKKLHIKLLCSHAKQGQQRNSTNMTNKNKKKIEKYISQLNKTSKGTRKFLFALQYVRVAQCVCVCKYDFADCLQSGVGKWRENKILYKLYKLNGKETLAVTLAKVGWSNENVSEFSD